MQYVEFCERWSHVWSTLNTINVAGTPVALSDSIKILVLDKNLHLRLSHFSRFQIMFLPHSGAPSHTTSTRGRCRKMVACSLVGSRLDYANSVFFGTSAKISARFHRIQSTLARVVTMQRGRICI